MTTFCLIGIVAVELLTWRAAGEDAAEWTGERVGGLVVLGESGDGVLVILSESTRILARLTGLPSLSTSESETLLFIRSD